MQTESQNKMDYRLPALNYGSESCHQIISARFKYQEEQSSVHDSATLTFSSRHFLHVADNRAQKSIVTVIQNLYNKNTSVCMLNQKYIDIDKTIERLWAL